MKPIPAFLISATFTFLFLRLFFRASIGTRRFRDELETLQRSDASIHYPDPP